MPLPPLSHWRAAPELCVLLVLSVGRTMRARTHASHTGGVWGWGLFQTQDCMVRGASSYLQAGEVPLPSPLEPLESSPRAVCAAGSVGRGADDARARARASHTGGVWAQMACHLSRGSDMGRLQYQAPRQSGEVPQAESDPNCNHCNQINTLVVPGGDSLTGRLYDTQDCMIHSCVCESLPTCTHLECPRK